MPGNGVLCWCATWPTTPPSTTFARSLPAHRKLEDCCDTINGPLRILIQSVEHGFQEPLQHGSGAIDRPVPAVVTPPTRALDTLSSNGIAARPNPFTSAPMLGGARLNERYKARSSNTL